MRAPQQRRLRKLIRCPELLADHVYILRVPSGVFEQGRDFKLPAREVERWQISELEEPLGEAHTRVRVRRRDASDIEPQILKEPYPVPRPRQDVREHGAPPDRLEGLADCDHEVIGALQHPALR
jgi:hypothetical protein